MGLHLLQGSIKDYLSEVQDRALAFYQVVAMAAHVHINIDSPGAPSWVCQSTGCAQFHLTLTYFIIVPIHKQVILVHC